MSDVLLVARDAPVAGAVTLTLNRPEKRNALSIELRDAISDALDALVADDSVRCVVLTGAGDVFCAGFDLREFEVDDAEFQRRLWASAERFHRVVQQCALPVVAAVNGPALAGGFDLAVMSDIRIASTTARFGHPEQRWSDVIYGPLHDIVGGIARDLCLTGRSIDADEALRIGLVSAVVDPAGLAAAVGEWCAGIVAAPRANLLRTKSQAVAALPSSAVL